ncbi:MAG TPA: hypothetical protein VFH77_17505 [Streptomyces sp.]|nr:hypothetical protein [Streptomyces sp.]
MNAREDAVTSLVNGGWGRQIAREIIARVVAEARTDEARRWAAKIREVGTAKGWSVWAAAYIDPDTAFTDTGMPPTETIVAELRRLDRVQTLRDAADWFERACPDVEALLPVCMCHAAAELRRLADEAAKDPGARSTGQATEATQPDNSPKEQ